MPAVRFGVSSSACGSSSVAIRYERRLASTERPRFKLPGVGEAAGGFVAQMPGKVIELRVKVGDRVTAGDTVLVLEAMKMEHPMRATEDGIVVEVRVAEGEQVESGTLLLVVEPAEEDNAQKDGK